MSLTSRWESSCSRCHAFTVVGSRCDCLVVAVRSLIVVGVVSLVIVGVTESGCSCCESSCRCYESSSSRCCESSCSRYG